MHNGGAVPESRAALAATRTVSEECLWGTKTRDEGELTTALPAGPVLSKYSPDYHPSSALGFTKAEAEGGR